MNPSLHPSYPSPRLTLIEVEDIPKSREDDGDFEAAIIRVCRDYERRVVKFMPEDLEDWSAYRSVGNAGQQRHFNSADHNCMETEESSALNNFPDDKKPFKVGQCYCEWFYALIPRMCHGLRGIHHEEIGKHKGWLIKRKCWHGDTWFQLPEELKEFWNLERVPQAGLPISQMVGSCELANNMAPIKPCAGAIPDTLTTLPNTIPPNTSQAGGNLHAAGLAPLILQSV